ncbi:P-loop NTPase fold protein [Aliarcobacter butzleri]
MFYILCNHYYNEKEKKESTDLSPDNEFKDYDSQKVAGVKNIIDSHNDNSFFSLALIGDWGSGKSSFLKKLKEEIEDKDEDFVIYLNVWELENIQNILQEIEKEFDNIVFKLSSIEWILYHLKSILVKNYFSLLSKYFKENNIKIDSPFSNTIKDSKDEYNILLKRVLKDKKIVLMIDELDRLESKKDLLDIFKIIRYLASFDKVFAITAVDMNKLEIERSYIHKIFNSKYVIPKATRDELLNFLMKKGSEKLSKFIDNKETFYNMINKDIIYNRCLIDFITNFREIKNICNDSYIMCTSLEKKISNWKDFISFEFIFLMNLIKSVNIDLYIKFMNEEYMTKQVLINYFSNYEKDLEKNPYKYIIEEYLIYKNILFVCSSILKETNKLEQFLYIFTHYNIYYYMFTEEEYEEFLNSPKLIIKKLNDLKEHEIIKGFKSTEQRDNFIKFLISRIHKEKNIENRVKLIKEIFSSYPKDKLLNIIYNKIENFRNVDYSSNTIEELLKLYFKELDSKKINDIIFNIFSIIKDDSLYKILYRLLNNPSNKTYFKNYFTQYRSNLYLRSKELFDFIKLINEYFEENYDTYFEDEKIYYLYIQEDKYNPNHHTKREITGKEVKEFIEKDDELQKLIEEYKDSKK